MNTVAYQHIILGQNTTVPQYQVLTRGPLPDICHGGTSWSCIILKVFGFEENNDKEAFSEFQNISLSKLSAKRFSWKWDLLAWELNIIALSLSLKQKLWATRKWPNPHPCPWVDPMTNAPQWENARRIPGEVGTLGNFTEPPSVYLEFANNSNCRLAMSGTLLSCHYSVL